MDRGASGSHSFCWHICDFCSLVRTLSYRATLMQDDLKILDYSCKDWSVAPTHRFYGCIFWRPMCQCTPRLEPHQCQECGPRCFPIYRWDIPAGLDWNPGCGSVWTHLGSTVWGDYSQPEGPGGLHLLLGVPSPSLAASSLSLLPLQMLLLSQTLGLLKALQDALLSS